MIQPRAIAILTLGLTALVFCGCKKPFSDREQNNRIYRREFTLFGGYRYPFTDTFSLEGIVFAMARNARHRYPNDDRLDDREADAFQAKINFYLKWDFSKDAYIVLTPSFELDSFGWGGGGLQVYYVF